jgi:hypothetical protein
MNCVSFFLASLGSGHDIVKKIELDYMNQTSSQNWTNKPATSSFSDKVKQDQGEKK